MNNSLFCRIVLFIGTAVAVGSCTSVKNFTTKYYYQNEQALDKIEESYKTLYKQGAFNIVFTNKAFSIFSIEIITDSLTYVYQFEINESRFADTLTKYHLNANGINELISDMRSIHCIWINSLDYYLDDERKMLVFISIKPRATTPPFTYDKYYILSYFTQKQYFDNAGRLLVRRKLRNIHKINGDIFHRINDHICYAVAGRFR